MIRFLVVPQWQGSSSARAMRLAEGATALAEDLPRSATRVVPVPLGAGEPLGTGALRASSLRQVASSLGEALAEAAPVALVVGGDRTVALPAVAHSSAGHEALALVWLSARAGLRSFDGTVAIPFEEGVLRAVLGEGPEGLTLPAGRIAPGRLVLGGVRDLSPSEADLLRDRGAVTVSPGALSGDIGALSAALASSGADAVHVHLDLDVLDPSAVGGLLSPVPFGVDVPALTAAIAALRAALPLAGASLSGFAPSSPAAAVDDLGAVLRLLGALA